VVGPPCGMSAQSEFNKNFLEKTLTCFVLIEA
jgi:hypothetical protein